MTPLCTCPEPAATFPEDYPDGMHTHEDCRVYHKGKECAMKQSEQLALRAIEEL